MIICDTPGCDYMRDSTNQSINKKFPRNTNIQRVDSATCIRMIDLLRIHIHVNTMLDRLGTNGLDIGGAVNGMIVEGRTTRLLVSKLYTGSRKI